MGINGVFAQKQHMDSNRTSKEKKATGCHWVSQDKHEAYGNVQCHKACLIAKCHFEKRKNYDEVFVPIVKQGSTRILLSIAVFGIIHEELSDIFRELFSIVRKKRFIYSNQQVLKSQGKQKQQKSIYKLKQAIK